MYDKSKVMNPSQMFAQRILYDVGSAKIKLRSSDYKYDTRGIAN